MNDISLYYRIPQIIVNRSHNIMLRRDSGCSRLFQSIENYLIDNMRNMQLIAIIYLIHFIFLSIYISHIIYSLYWRQKIHDSLNSNNCILLLIRNNTIVDHILLKVIIIVKYFNKIDNAS